MNENIETLPPIYKAAIVQLEDDLNSTTHLEEKRNHILYFAEEYFLLYEYWFYVRHTDFNEFGVATNIITWTFEDILQKKLQENFRNAIKEAEKLLEIPCEALKEIYEIFLQYSTQPPTRSVIRKYKKALAIRAELFAMESNFEAFISVIEKLNDNELTITFFEYFLIANFTQKATWKYYITFLCNVDKKKMLMACKHYTRFFIEDTEMVTEYREKIKDSAKILNSVSFWMADTIDWEFKYGDEKFAYTMLEDYLNTISMYEEFKLPRTCLDQLYNYFSIFQIDLNKFHTVSSNLMQIFSVFEEWKTSADVDEIERKLYNKNNKVTVIFANFDNTLKQDFDFPTPMLRHALKNISLTLLQKLYQSCKYFFAIFKIPLCYRLVVGGSKTQYYEQSLQISDADYHKPKFQELIKRMKIVNCLQWNLTEDNLSIGDVIQKENISQIKYIFIQNKKISADKLVDLFI
uniref:Uncharacterized protein n=1 Tax=Panagrolaimus sp. ES5 TaxID=591445 RepID=A0AC34FA16_9BILA